MTIGTRLYTLFFGEFVGRDKFGNRYYKSRSKKAGKHIGKPGTERRWVIYKGLKEPSKVPARWHGWLHYTTDDNPEENARTAYEWEKEHMPNLTGTDAAYRPSGHVSQGGKRAKATGDYQAWQPD